MPETRSLVGIYGAIDRAVQNDPQARARVAQLLPAYRNPKVKWYDEFEEWVGGSANGEDGGDADFPGLVEALHELGQEGAAGRTLARRMFAVMVINKAFPDMRVEGEDLSEPAIRALRAPVGKEGAEPVEPTALYELLTRDGAREVGPETPGGRNWWRALISAAVSRNLIPNTTGMYPPPCSARLVKVPEVAGAVAALRTDWTTAAEDKIGFDAATRFIEPANWETCMPDFWCDMHQNRDSSLPVGQRRYHEIVSTHCADKGALGFWAETELLFSFMWLPGATEPRAAVANYELVPERPLPRDRILVDEGTLLVEKIGNGETVRVITTKRVKFSYPFMTEALPLIMCALGYADLSGGLLSCAARRGKDLKDVGTPFPGVSPNEVAAGAAPQAAGMTGLRNRPGARVQSRGLFQDAAEIWTRSARDWATAMERAVGAPGTEAVTTPEAAKASKPANAAKPAKASKPAKTPKAAKPRKAAKKPKQDG